MKDQNQSSGDNSTNFQANTVNIHGVSATEARQIAIDVYNSNFMSLSGIAKDIARARAEEITEEFIGKLQQQNPIGLEQSKDPDFQHALFGVQKEYARCGDKGIGELLIDILIDRSKHPSRDILQIVLNESLTVAPKLTTDQLAALSIIFLFRYTINNDINSLSTFYKYLDIHIKPFSNSISNRQASYQHLEYSGCGAISITSIELPQLICRQYGGLFSKSLDEIQFENKQFIIPRQSPIFSRCINNENNIQVNAINEETIKIEAHNHNIPESEIPKLLAMHNESMMNNEEIKDITIKGAPYMSNIFDIWSNSAMKNITLTSVGIAIGHANVKKDIGEFTNLSLWIN